MPTAERFDLVVIGSGSAGSAVAGRCRRVGWRVAVIDERPLAAQLKATLFAYPTGASDLQYMI